MTFEILAGALKVQQLSEALLATAGRKIKFDYWLAKITQASTFIDKKGKDVTPTNVVRTFVQDLRVDRIKGRWKVTDVESRPVDSFEGASCAA